MTTAIARQNFDGYIGRGLDLNLVIEEDGVVRDITSDVVTFTLRRFQDDAAATVTKTSASGSEIYFTDATNGACTVFLKQADTTGLNPELYHYRVSVVTPSSRNFTVIDGCITFTQN